MAPLPSVALLSLQTTVITIIEMAMVMYYEQISIQGQSRQK